MTARLEVIDVHKEFVMAERRLPILRGVNLSVAAGESIAILGVSGAGKSTLLHIMGGLDHPTSGEVRVDGQAIFGRSEEDLARFRNRNVGFVFQFHHLLEEFSALENVVIPMAISGVARRKAAVAAQDSLERVGLGDRLQHRPAELSGGEQQRVAIARALVCKPTLLLMDEPTGNLDLATGEEVHRLIRESARAAGATIVVVTHNPHLAGMMDRVLRIVDGRFVEEAVG